MEQDTNLPPSITPEFDLMQSVGGFEAFKFTPVDVGFKPLEVGSGSSVSSYEDLWGLMQDTQFVWFQE